MIKGFIMSHKKSKENKKRCACEVPLPPIKEPYRLKLGKIISKKILLKIIDRCH